MLARLFSASPMMLLLVVGTSFFGVVEPSADAIWLEMKHKSITRRFEIPSLCDVYEKDTIQDVKYTFYVAVL
jgi:hypothetical protein